MGNCQAAEPATVVIEHADGKMERVCWSLNAHDVMAANPGHYVAVVITVTVSKPGGNAGGAAAATTAVKYLKLLRPDDMLHIGHVYRLVSFEEVMREFGSKKHVRLSRLLAKQSDGDRSTRRERRRATRCLSQSSSTTEDSQAAEQREEQQQEAPRKAHVASRCSVGVAAKQPQWRPTLQSIAEVGADACRI